MTWVFIDLSYVTVSLYDRVVLDAVKVLNGYDPFDIHRWCRGISHL